MSIELAGITVGHLAVVGALALAVWRSYLLSKRPTWEYELMLRLRQLRRGRDRAAKGLSGE